MVQKPVLIESWLPIEAIGAESKRERGASSALPPLYFLHVWWARRPLIASRAAILASVLPQWSEKWPLNIRSIFSNQETYHQWFLRLCGIFGDPVAARKLIDWEKSIGIRSKGDKYGYTRAFAHTPIKDDFETLRLLLEYVWGQKDISVLDPFSGGGSIPFEAQRFGFITHANDLNPVAAIILKSTLEYPAKYGLSLVDDIYKWGKRWNELVSPILAPFFSSPKGELPRTVYMWARTISCPTTGKPIPLSPNWWIRKGDQPVTARLIAEKGMSEPKFEIVHGRPKFDPEVGTVSGGSVRSPWTGEVFNSDYVKSEAQAGRMGQILYCLEIERNLGRDYVSPTEEDEYVFQKSADALKAKQSEWITQGILPSESFPNGNDNRPVAYGMPYWADFFSERQLYSICTCLEKLRELEGGIRSENNPERAEAILTYLSLSLDKMADYNCKLATWETTRQIVKHLFQRHDFSFKWSYGEYNASTILVNWAVGQIADAYKGISNLVTPSQRSFSSASSLDYSASKPRIYQGSASNLSKVVSKSIENITVDPPYYDNVQYSELSDFFYVWLKRSVGHLFPEFFLDELTNKDDEAVANPARFGGMGRKKKELAEQDYERKMLAAFREMHRVLRDDGVLTIMFTHKKVEAWDTLASAIIGAGFVIKASWPIHTESEHSLHQAKKNAASSTILLVCRKREPVTKDQVPVWWDDIKETVRQTARQKAEEFVGQGIHGVDLYLSTFGPTLSILSDHWPVLTSEVDPKTGQPKSLRPETALNLAREEVVRLRKQGLLLGREVNFDPATDWYLMTWDAFHAEQFPYDEGRKLAIALGIELDSFIIAQKRLATKKGGFISLQTPVQRRKKGMVDDEITSFPAWIDAAHTAMMIYEEDGPGACDAFLQKSGLKRDSTFKACLQALISAIPRNRIKGKFLRPEAEILENMRLAFFDDLQAPVEEEPELPPAVQMGLWEEEVGVAEGDDEEEVTE